MPVDENDKPIKSFSMQQDLDYSEHLAHELLISQIHIETSSLKTAVL